MLNLTGAKYIYIGRKKSIATAHQSLQMHMLRRHAKGYDYGSEIRKQRLKEK